MSMRDDLRLRPYQELVLTTMMHRNAYAVWLKPGLGKTLTTLMALHRMREGGFIHGHVLILAPLAVVRSTWNLEIAKWGFDDLSEWYPSVRIESGRTRTRKRRWRMYDELADRPDSLVIINHENAVDMVDYFLDGPGKAAGWPCPTIVIDEAQGFKSYASKRFKALKRLVDGGHVSRLYELTGSPQPGGIEDLFAQLYLMDRGGALGRNITAFRDRFEKPSPWVEHVWMPKGPDSVAEVHGRVRPWSLSMDTPGVRMPELVMDDIRIPMPDPVKARYKAFARDAVLELADGDVEAANAGVLAAKLAQFASGTIYTAGADEGRGPDDYEVLHTLKADVLADIMANSDSPVMVARWFQSDERELLARFGPSSPTPLTPFHGTLDEVRAWNRGGIPYALVCPAALSAGVNLQDGPGHTIVWYTLPMGSLLLYEQFNARIHRPGQRATTVIHRLLTAGTFDERMVDILADKDASQNELFGRTAATGLNERYQNALVEAVRAEIGGLSTGC